MRLDIVSENPAESVAAAAGLLPGSVVKVVWGFTMARAILAAVELGVLDALAAGDLTGAEVATKTSCDEEATTVLLNALNGFGVLRRKAGRYGLRRETRRTLTKSGGNDMSAAILLGGVLDEKLRGLTAAVRSGQRPDFHASLTPAQWDAYLRGLGALARITAGEVVRKIKLAAPARLLDVGGGHGVFTVALCRRHPTLRATLLDLPGGARVSRALIAETDVADRIDVREGDLRTAPWGEGHDVVLLFNILHNLPEADARRAVAQAHEALKPGGTLAILEGQHAGKDGDLSFQEGFGELLFFLLSQSNTWPAPTMRGWMQDAGFSRIQHKRLFTLPGAALLLAQRPQAVG